MKIGMPHIAAFWDNTVRKLPRAAAAIQGGETTTFAQADESVARLAGYLADVCSVDKGDRVEAGQVLLRLDCRQWEHILKKAEVELADARSDLERWDELKQAGAVSDSDFDDILRRARLAEIASGEARVHLSQCELICPISGVVDDRYVEAGEYANEGARLVKVIDIDRVKLTVDIPERDIVFVEPGNRIPFSVPVCADTVFTGRVTFVSGVARRENNAYRVEAAVSNIGRVLKGGMIARAEIGRGTVSAAVVVPLAAVVPRKGDHVVFVVRGDRAERRVVRIDSITGHEAILASGLAVGETIVVEGHRALQDGVLLEVIRAEAAQRAQPDAGADHDRI